MESFLGNAIIINCTFKNNTASSILNGNGGALYLSSSSNVSLYNNIFSNNLAYQGGAVFYDSSGYNEKKIIFI